MRIGILTEEPSNEDVAVALKEAGEKLGAEIVIVDLNECAVVNTASPQVLHKGAPLVNLDAMLVRGSESKLAFRTHIVDQLAATGCLMINKSEAIMNCDDKFETQALLNKAGVKTPDTVIVVQIEQLDVAVKQLNSKFPMVVKTTTGSHGVGVIKVGSYESLKSLVQYLLAQKTSLMIQEFIAHKESGRIMVLGGKIVASVMRSIPDGDFRSNMDQGAELSKHDASEKEQEVALTVAKTLGCDLSAIDYIVSEEGQIVVFEANSSPGLKGIQSVNVGIDIAANIMEYIVDKAKSKDVSYEEEEEIKLGGTAVKQDTQSPSQGLSGKKSEDAANVKVFLGLSASEEEEEEEAAVVALDSTVGLEERLIIKRINNDEPFQSKVDTGADRCSLHGDNIEIGENYVRFTINEVRYKVPFERSVKVLAANGTESRPIVSFDVVFNGVTHEAVEFNIADRSSMSYQTIIGKNLLIAAGVAVDPAQ